MTKLQSQAPQNADSELLFSRQGLTDTEAGLGVMAMAPLAVQGGGVATLTVVETVPASAGLLADGGGENDLDLLDPLC